jgi:hypothetical protein
MNSRLKTTLIVIGLIVVVWAIFAMAGGNNSPTVTGDNNASTSVQADRSTGLPKTSGNYKAQDTTSTGLISDSALAMIIGNTLITVPQTGVDVALSAGNADYTSGSSKGHVSIGKILGRITTDNGTDVVTEMTLTKYNSLATFKYVAMFHNVGTNVTYTSSILIGDRVTISGITVSADKSVTMNPSQKYMSSSLGYNFMVSYLDRKNGEPLTTTPSVPKSVTVHVKNHILATN